MDEDFEEFFEIVQDLVYVIVRSIVFYISIDFVDDFDWLENFKFVGGIIKFFYEGFIEEKVVGLEFVGLFQLNVFFLGNTVQINIGRFYIGKNRQQLE